MKTFAAKKEEAERNWVLVDASDRVVGKVAVEIASILRGKTKPVFTPHVDTGDFVVVINADKVRFTGRKMEQKTYYRHSGHMGGLKAVTAKSLMAKKPEDVLMHAVKGMLPKNSLGKSMIKKLKIYAGGDHPHEAQLPKSVTQ